MTDFNIDALLDGTLDDLADAPEFRNYPAGTHRFYLSMELKEVNKHPAVEARLKAIETVELQNPEDTPLSPGAETSVLYFLDNSIGQGAFKKILGALAEHFGSKSPRELMEEAKNLECFGVTRTRQNKDKTKSYDDIVELKVA